MNHFSIHFTIIHKLAQPFRNESAGSNRIHGHYLHIAQFHCLSDCSSSTFNLFHFSLPLLLSNPYTAHFPLQFQMKLFQELHTNAFSLFHLSHHQSSHPRFSLLPRLPLHFQSFPSANSCFLCSELCSRTQ